MRCRLKTTSNGGEITPQELRALLSGIESDQAKRRRIPKKHAEAA